MVNWRNLGGLSFALGALACGPGVNREVVLPQLRSAIDAEITDDAVREEHNRLVEEVREGAVLHGMRRFEVQEAIGRGDNCGNRDICGRQGFAPSDWVYDVGRREGMAAGPTLLVGFDRQGIVVRVYSLTRR